MWENDNKTGRGIYGRLEKVVRFYGRGCNRKRYMRILGWLYEGEFLNGFKHGRGEYIFDNGVRSYHYSGDWVMNKEHGVGKYTCIDGTVYEGEWQIGKKHGNGVYRDNLGINYEGGWDGDRYHGVGKYTCSDGIVYEGEWQIGKKHGNGVYRDKLGNIYEGGWNGDRYHGIGILTNEITGERKEGEWCYGELFNGAMHSPTTKVSKLNIMNNNTRFEVQVLNILLGCKQLN